MSPDDESAYLLGQHCANAVLDRRPHLAQPEFRAVTAMLEALRPDLGCCTHCDGWGIDGTPETGGLCADCRGTGHAHPGACYPIADCTYETLHGYSVTLLDYLTERADL